METRDNWYQQSQKWRCSLLAREINWMETTEYSTANGRIDLSLLAREINWMETLLITDNWQLNISSLLAREINWMETGVLLMYLFFPFSLYSLEKLIEWKRESVFKNGRINIGSLLAREINWMETRRLKSCISSIDCSLLAREINWMETEMPDSINRWIRLSTR